MICPNIFQSLLAHCMPYKYENIEIIINIKDTKMIF